MNIGASTIYTNQPGGNLVHKHKTKNWTWWDCKTVVFSSKSVKKSVKRGVRVLRARSARASHARRACEAREKSVSPQSRSLFSASFQTFCLTARSYLNTQEYGLFCSLDVVGERPVTKYIQTSWTNQKEKKISPPQNATLIFWSFHCGTAQTIWFSNRNVRFSHVNGKYPWTLTLYYFLCFYCEQSWVQDMNLLKRVVVLLSRKWIS